ncbi:prolyl oligopeptidase family serine peptidase [Actinoplanes missouriensis]|nr:PHB depolymerase family esterase [Actinoplanes missouriensis]
MPISRRTALAAGLGAGIGAGIGAGLGVSASASPVPDDAGFDLFAETLDGGEQVTAVILRTARLGGVDPASVNPGTFTVHARATSPFPALGVYDVDRTVTAARLDRRGNIVLELAHGEGQVGGGTLGYVLSRGRNVRLDLVYTITQNTPLVLRGGRPVTFPGFTQGRLLNPEVDAFGYHESASGMKYRLYAPRGRGRRPLVVWLHGGGEGASLPDGYYDNETTLRANRGALGFATREAQQIFDDAYVVAPQSFSYWMEDGDRFAPLIREVIRDVARRHPVDPRRIHVVGCSNGGYMSMKMTVAYPSLFASSIPICGIVTGLISDAELAGIRTPSWLVTSLDDDTVGPQPNTVHAAEVIPGARVTLYDHVIRDGHQFPGHWSWIYVARNDRHYWQWMAGQRRRTR